ncbi:MAG: WD40 repeat domain-containing protein, partial [Planctomycetota bacterium]|nr:WD40 repeat domain-containing protein [Planctomycetota bacterium]
MNILSVVKKIALWILVALARHRRVILLAWIFGLAAWFLYDPSAPRVVASWDRRFEDAVAEFTPDGARFILGDNRGGAVYDSKTGAMLARLQGFDALRAELLDDAGLTAADLKRPGVVEEYAIVGPRFARDGRRAAATVRGTLFDAAHVEVAWTVSRLVWEVATGRLVRRYDGDLEQLTLEFSSDGTLLAAALHDHTIEVWDLARDRLAAWIEAKQPFAFSPDGRTILANGAWLKESGRDVALWDVATSRVIWTRSGADTRGPEGDVTDVGFGPDGRSLLVGYDNARAYWIDLDGKLIEKFDRCKIDRAGSYSAEAVVVLSDCAPCLIACPPRLEGAVVGQAWDWSTSPQRPIIRPDRDDFESDDHATHVSLARDNEEHLAAVVIEHRDGTRVVPAAFALDGITSKQFNIAADGSSMVFTSLSSPYPDPLVNALFTAGKRLGIGMPEWLFDNVRRDEVFDLGTGRRRAILQCDAMFASDHVDLIAAGGDRILHLNDTDFLRDPETFAGDWQSTRVTLWAVPPAHHPLWDYAP